MDSPYVLINKKIVGKVVGDTFLKPVKDEHYFRKFHGFGISEEIIARLRRDDVKKIRIVWTHIDRSITILEVDFNRFVARSEKYTFRGENEDFDAQYVCPTKWMIHISGPKPPAPDIEKGQQRL